MTPKEKAAELINKMYYTQSSPAYWVQAKECALIAVDEILSMVDESMQGFLDSDIIRYWKQVKQEIELL